jgi:hypothetical protein
LQLRNGELDGEGEPVKALANLRRDLTLLRRHGATLMAFSPTLGEELDGGTFGAGCGRQRRHSVDVLAVHL